MKNSVKILFFLFVIGIFHSVLAQDCKEIVPDSEVEVQEFKAVDAKDYEGWKKIDIPNYISFYAPADFEKVEKESKSGSHSASEFIEFKNAKFKLNGDFTGYGYYPDITKTKLPSYCEWYSWIDGAFAYFWSFEKDTERYKYESGIYFQFKEDKNYRLSLYIQSKDKETKEITEKIFKSIEFLKRPVAPKELPKKQ